MRVCVDASGACAYGKRGGEKGKKGSVRSLFCMLQSVVRKNKCTLILHTHIHTHIHTHLRCALARGKGKAHLACVRASQPPAPCFCFGMSAVAQGRVGKLLQCIPVSVRLLMFVLWWQGDVIVLEEVIALEHLL